MRKPLLATVIVSALFAMVLVPSVSASTLGDTNGDGKITILDAGQVMMYFTPIVNPYPPFDLVAADVNCDGFINVIDYNLIVSHINGIITEFPCGNEPPPIDSDGDGVYDDVDACPYEYGTEPDGCPPTVNPIDSDGDGVYDDVDTCPYEYGTGADGCPELEYYTVSITVSPTTGGTVSGGRGYYHGDLAELVATPSPGYTFSGWGGDASGTSSNKRIAVDGNKDVVAYFDEVPPEPERYALTLHISPYGTGSVTVYPDPEDGGYLSGTRLDLGAIPSEGYMFDYWGGLEAYGGWTLDYPSARPLIVGDMVVTANFKLEPIISYTLTTSVSPVGTGAVYPRFGVFEAGQEIELVAVPADGFWLDCWVIPPEGATPPAVGMPSPIRFENPTIVTMNDDLHVEARFSEVPAPPPDDYILWIGLAVSGAGIVGVVLTTSKVRI